jgi:methyl-accepting chemotaxis protein
MNARIFASWGLGGVCVGSFFPVLAMLLQVLSFDADSSIPARMWRAQSLPAMWVVDLLPFVLGLVAGLFGLRENQVHARDADKREQLTSMAGELFSGAQGLLSTVSSFSAMTSQTASAVRGTTATVQRLGQTAAQAALTAETVVGLASNTKKYSEEGMKEIRLSISELLKLSDDVRGLSKSIEGINERMRNIFEIAAIMNYLGERFQSLADSAASEIEQSSDGLPLGLRFVVAEMRRQGKDAQSGATLVQSIVNEMQKVMMTAMASADSGIKRAERGARIANKTGDNIKKLSAALESSERAALGIATIAKEQDQGIDEVLRSMNGVYLATEEAVVSTQRAALAAQALNELAGRLDSSARSEAVLPPIPALRMPRALLRSGGGSRGQV